MKNAGVIYDRAHSSFADLQPGMIDWDTVLKDVSWFHFSAISPALNENVVAVCEEGAAARCRKRHYRFRRPELPRKTMAVRAKSQ